MLSTLGRYADFDLTVRAEGDDIHHLIEDVGIVLGAALAQAKGKTPVERMASCTLPMDDALVTVSLDLVDRPFAELDCPDPLYHHFLRSFAMSAGMTLHVMVHRGFDEHHVVEATFKALGNCLSSALRIRSQELSTKEQAVMRSG
jgi:imidazoleglycerol-phosphate dehydratase